MVKLSNFIREYYGGVRRGIKEDNLKYKVSDTLVTKLLLGIIGCVPAYDRYFCIGI